MKTVNVYLNFDGNTEEVFNFYKSVFGGELSVMRFKDIPPEAGKFPDVDQNKIMHVSLPLGNGTVLMGSDIIESMGPEFKAGNNFHINIYAESKEEADKLFDALSKGGKVTMPLSNAFWGDYFGMLEDKFGIQWMFIFSTNQNRSN